MVVHMVGISRKVLEIWWYWGVNMWFQSCSLTTHNGAANRNGTDSTNVSATAVDCNHRKGMEIAIDESISLDSSQEQGDQEKLQITRLCCCSTEKCPTNTLKIENTKNGSQRSSRKSDAHLQSTAQPTTGNMENCKVKESNRFINKSKTKTYLERIDHMFYISSAIACGMWLILIVIVYLITDAKDWVYLMDEERRAAQIAIIIQATAFIMQMLKVGIDRLVILDPTRSSSFSSTYGQDFQNDKKKSTSDIAANNHGTNSNSKPDPVSDSKSFFFGRKRIDHLLPDGSGILVAAITVQMISFITNCMLAYAPTAVKIDRVTHTRVYLLRWCEWIPLSGVQTFLSECLDVSLINENKDDDISADGNVDHSKKRSNQKYQVGKENAEGGFRHRGNTNGNSDHESQPRRTNENSSYSVQQKSEHELIGLRTVTLWSISQTASCIPGLLFPFCNDLLTWNALMLFAMVSYMCIFPRVLIRRQLYLNALSNLDAKVIQNTQARKSHQQNQNNDDTNNTRHQMPSVSVGHSTTQLASEHDHFQKRRFSYLLLLACTCLWTALVIAYFLNMGSQIYQIELIPRSIVSQEAVAMIFDTMFDIVAKIVYMRLVMDVYIHLFDSNQRTLRQLNELRQLVSAIWESSSDVIAISVRITPTRVISVISPSFTTLVNTCNGTGSNLTNETAHSQQQQQHQQKNRDDVSARIGKLSNCSSNRKRTDPPSTPLNTITTYTPAVPTSSNKSHDYESRMSSASLVLELETFSPKCTRNQQWSSFYSTVSSILHSSSSSLPPLPPPSEYKVLSAYYVDSSTIAIPSVPISSESIITLVDLDSFVVTEAAQVVSRSWESLRKNQSPNSLNNPYGSESDDSITSLGRGTSTSNDVSSCKGNVYGAVRDYKSSNNKDDEIFIVKQALEQLDDNAKWLLDYHSVKNVVGDQLTCEIKVSRHAENVIVAVVRDVSERDRRFEAERKAHAETLARQRDAQSANRFTRHEVKNGLLAGIELCDNMRSSFIQLKQSIVQEMHQVAFEMRSRLPQDIVDELSSNSVSKTSTITNDGNDYEVKKRENPAKQIYEEKVDRMVDHVLNEGVLRHVSDIDKTLQEVLETILTEAMSREVVHEVYVPRLERVNIPVLMDRSETRNKRERFPIEILGKETMPELLLDVQLLNYIHRNAVSNACKYGKFGGIVATKVWYDSKDQIFSLQITNEPGLRHDELVEMGDAANAAVFKQGVRLQVHKTTEGVESATSGITSGGTIVDSRASSGDGAWIMQKCAMTLGGTCTIKFHPTCTIFTFVCPAKAVSQDSDAALTALNYQDFRVPPNTWGIAVDDSNIQRKLMDRILANVGVVDTNRVLLGEKSEDMDTFTTLMRSILSNDNDCKVLIMMDENLDYVENDAPVTISGSFAVKELLDSLPIEQQRRVLALIRSANDSAEDIGWYSDRSHGFFPKATMQRDRVRELLAPLWQHRFSMNSSTTTVSSSTITINKNN